MVWQLCWREPNSRWVLKCRIWVHNSCLLYEASIQKFAVDKDATAIPSFFYIGTKGREREKILKLNWSKASDHPNWHTTEIYSTPATSVLRRMASGIRDYTLLLEFFTIKQCTTPCGIGYQQLSDKRNVDTGQRISQWPTSGVNQYVPSNENRTSDHRVETCMERLRQTITTTSPTQGS